MGANASVGGGAGDSLFSGSAYGRRQNGGSGGPCSLPFSSSRREDGALRSAGVQTKSVQSSGLHALGRKIKVDPPIGWTVFGRWWNSEGRYLMRPRRRLLLSRPGCRPL